MCDQTRGVGIKKQHRLTLQSHFLWTLQLPVDPPTSCMLLRPQSKEQSGLTDQQTGPAPPPSPPPHLGSGRTPALVSLSVRFVTYGNAVDRYPGNKQVERANSWTRNDGPVAGLV